MEVKVGKMDRQNAIGAAQVVGGTYLGYQGIKHGLPRALGLRTEYHTTSKTNADLIKKAGNILDPACGGKNGWAEKAGDASYVKSSRNYVHITGLHKDNIGTRPLFGKFTAPLRMFYRKTQCLMYKTFGNIDVKKFQKCFVEGDKKAFIINMAKEFKNSILHNRTKKFCISGTDSYFNTKFIPDADDIALKSAEKIKVYNNRFSSMIAGLKKFGLSGMKENKSRVAFGVGLLSLGTYSAVKLIQKGVNNICKS